MEIQEEELKSPESSPNMSESQSEEALDGNTSLHDTSIDKASELVSNLLTEETGKGEDCKPVEPQCRIILCDFAGQRDYYATHHIFLDNMAIYVLVLDISKHLDEIAVDELTDVKTGING